MDGYDERQLLSGAVELLPMLTINADMIPVDGGVILDDVRSSLMRVLSDLDPDVRICVQLWSIRCVQARD